MDDNQSPEPKLRFLARLRSDGKGNAAKIITIPVAYVKARCIQPNTYYWVTMELANKVWQEPSSFPTTNLSPDIIIPRSQPQGKAQLVTSSETPAEGGSSA